MFVYAIATGAAETDPAAMIGRALEPTPPRKKRPALLNLDSLRQMICDAEAVPAHPVTRLAFRLLALTVVRPSELRGASWEEFGDLDAELPIWCMPTLRMKGTMARKNEEGGDHLVPLSAHAIETLKVLRPLTGNGPSPSQAHAMPHKPISENAIGYAKSRPLRLAISGGNVHDSEMMHAFLDWPIRCQAFTNSGHAGAIVALNVRNGWKADVKPLLKGGGAIG